MGIINMKEKKYYTAGELARLFNIPKQTMLYYDKMGILKPEFVAENGYRYYSTPQYLTLEIILFLRKMDISVPDIHKFLENRSRDNILRILDRRKEECLQQIDQARRLIHSLDTYRNTLERVSVKFSSVIHLTVDNYYLRGFGFISISV